MSEKTPVGVLVFEAGGGTVIERHEFKPAPQRGKEPDQQQINEALAYAAKWIANNPAEGLPENWGRAPSAQVVCIVDRPRAGKMRRSYGSWSARHGRVWKQARMSGAG